MKKYLFLVLAILFLSGCVTYKDGEPVNDEADQKSQKEKKAEDGKREGEKSATEKKKDVEGEAVEKKKAEKKKRSIDVNKEIELNGVSIEVQSVSIEDGKITVPIWWSHWVSNEKTHLSLLVIPAAYQGNEPLEMIDGEDTLIRQRKKGVDDRAVVEFELVDNETPIEIKFIETTDEAKEESITVEIK